MLSELGTELVYLSATQVHEYPFAPTASVHSASNTWLRSVLEYKPRDPLHFGIIEGGLFISTADISSLMVRESVYVRFIVVILVMQNRAVCQSSV